MSNTAYKNNLFIQPCFMISTIPKMNKLKTERKKRKEYGKLSSRNQLSCVHAEFTN